MTIHILENEIHLWYTRYPALLDDGIFQMYISWLSTVEKKRLSNHLIASKMESYLISRALVRSVFSRYYPLMLPADWLFAENDYGKPYICNYPSLSTSVEFNLSHSNGITILALTNNDTIGIDCEYIDHDPFADEAVLEIFLTQEEISYIRDLHPGKRRLSLFKIWTLKEAFVKALGLGMSLPLNNICIKNPDIYKNIGCNSFDRLNYNNWQFIWAQDLEEYIISIVTRSAYNNSTYKIITREIIPACASTVLSFSETSHLVSDY